MMLRRLWDWLLYLHHRSDFSSAECWHYRRRDGSWSEGHQFRELCVQYAEAERTYEIMYKAPRLVRERKRKVVERRLMSAAEQDAEETLDAISGKSSGAAHPPPNPVPSLVEFVEG